MKHQIQGIAAALLCCLFAHPSVAKTVYVDVNGINPTPPFTNWATAATVIQDAVDAAAAGDEVLVTNGVYATGGRAVVGTMTNRVAVDKALTLRSVNGSKVTVIEGCQVPGNVNGDGAIRCVYLTNGAALSGFTLTKGAAFGSESGGGVRCESGNAVVTNCWLIGNSAVFGGGSFRGTLNNCALIGNSVSGSGGGAFYSTLDNCLISRNSAAGSGGGTCDSTLNNCTLTANSANTGGGTCEGRLYNCIVYCNAAQNGPNTSYSNLRYCLTTPLPWGTDNITNTPLFVDAAAGDYRLQSNSPCINAGNNAYVTTTTDMDGNPRIVGGTVDIGAYEFQTPTSLLSYAWLQQYGLPPDGSADAVDSDLDGLNNSQEWRAGTVPTNALSVLRLLTPTTNGISLVVTWESVAGRSYFLQRGSDLSAVPLFSLMATNLPGINGVMSFTDTNLPAGPGFYRVGVE